MNNNGFTKYIMSGIFGVLIIANFSWTTLVFFDINKKLTNELQHIGFNLEKKYEQNLSRIEASYERTETIYEKIDMLNEKINDRLNLINSGITKLCERISILEATCKKNEYRNKY